MCGTDHAGDDMKILVSILAAACLVASAHAEEVSVGGNTLDLTLPKGFCALGDSERENELKAQQRRASESFGELVQFGAPCDSIREFRDGKIDNFPHWAQVMILKKGGQIPKIAKSREEFLRDTAGSAETEKIDFEKVNRELKSRLAKVDASGEMTGSSNIGLQDSAFYISLHGKLSAGDRSVPFLAVMGLTVAKQMPLAVQVYGTPQAPDAPLFDVAHEYMESITAKN
jgi:hypothetical protein